MIIENQVFVKLLLLFLSSLASFIAIALLVELFLMLFKVESSPARVLCRLFAILKLPFDAILFLFFGRSLLRNLYPLTCEKSLHDLISLNVPHIWLQVTLLFIIAFSIWFTVKKALQFYTSTKYLNQIARASPLSKRQILSRALRERLLQQGCRIVSTARILVPCAYGRRTILLPAKLEETLLQDEYEAVIAHELEHLLRLDPYTKIVSLLISEIFWWVPMKWWLKRLETDQERACDLHVIDYGVENHSLASAVLKVLAESTERETVLHFSSKKRSPLLRIKMILEESHKRPQNRFSLILGCSACLSSSLFFTVWIC